MFAGTLKSVPESPGIQQRFRKDFTDTPGCHRMVMATPEHMAIQ